MQQSPGGATHVFTERAGTGYDLVVYSTSNGTRWSERNLGNAIDSSSFTGELNARGAGIIIGAGDNQVTAYPVDW